MVLSILFFLVGAIVSATVVYVYLSRTIAQANARALVEQQKNAELSIKLAVSEESVRSARELASVNEARHQELLLQSENTFKELAQRILEDRERKLKLEGTDILKDVVNALKGDIEAFRKQVSDSDRESAKTHAELMGRITTLSTLTDGVTQQANNLADAIRGDVRLSGEWGEIQLRRILEAAGFVENTDYTYQETFREDGVGRKSKRTDFVIRMPCERSLIIDSKNTIPAIERYHGAKNNEERTSAITDIITSVRKHIDEIKAAEYQVSVPNAFPSVLMYIPIEEVYLFAMKATISISGEHELLREYARRHGVVFVNSSSIVPVIKMVEMMWDAERSEKNRQEVVRAAEELLQRANAFISDFLSIGNAFKEVFVKYEAAKKSLIDGPRGQSVSKAVAKLVKLGTKPRTRSGKTYELAAPIVEQIEDNL